MSTKIDPALGYQFGTPGVYSGVPIEKYHGGTGLSKSGLDLLARSPAHYYAAKLDPARPPEEKKDSHIEGNALHCAVLEPNDWDARYVVIPEDAPAYPSVSQWNAAKPSPKSVADMAWWTDFEKRHTGKTFIKRELADQVRFQRDSLYRLGTARDLFKSGEAEVSAYAKDPITGAIMKCRPDFVHKASSKARILADLKGYSDVRDREFARQAARMNYDTQDAYYTDVFTLASGLEVLEFLFLAVEDKRPYAANIMAITPEDREAARQRYRPLVKVYADCMGSGQWPAFDDGVKLIKLPSWKARIAEESAE